jgi:hypothetical protein
VVGGRYVIGIMYLACAINVLNSTMLALEVETGLIMRRMKMHLSIRRKKSKAKRCKLIEFFYYRFTPEQLDEVMKILEGNILERYNSSEYWDTDLIDDYAQDNRLRRVGV